MAFDAHKNLAIATVATPPTPASSGGSLVVTTGQGQRFPVPPFNATVWPANAAPDPTNAEVVRVTARATDTLTITRAQEGTTARLIGAGDLIAQTITAKTLTDLETRAALKDEANVFTQKQTIERVTPQLVLTDLNQVPDQRTFDLVGYNLGLSVRALNDAQNAVIGEPLKLRRDGDVLVGKDLYEKGRAVGVGHYRPWTTSGFSAAAAAIGGTISAHFTLIGQTVFWRLICTSYVIPAPSAYLYFGLPTAYTPISGETGPALLRAYIPGASPLWQWVYADMNPGNMLVYWPGGNFPAGGGHLSGQGFYFSNAT